MKTLITDNRFIAFLLVLLIIAVYLLSTKEKTTYSTGYQQLLDSINTIQLGYDRRLQELQQQYTDDSERAAVLQTIVPTYTTAATNIKTKHNEIRHSYNNLPTDSQLVFFSNWLSKEASTR
jgi:K+ transporter